MNPVVLIPARMDSARLPGKPLADIAGRPMVIHVYARALEADIGPVWVATDSPAIVAAVEAHGGKVILTSKKPVSGSDRIAEALALMDDKNRFDAVINVQGDEPLLEPGAIRAALALLADRPVDIGTIGVLTEKAACEAPDVVKIAGAQLQPERMRALYFSRAKIPHGADAFVRHVGLYAYRRSALTRFISLPPSPLELCERLEQLRALEAGMRIDVALRKDFAQGVDTEDDLARVRAIFALKSSVL